MTFKVFVVKVNNLIIYDSLLLDNSIKTFYIVSAYTIYSILIIWTIWILYDYKSWLMHQIYTFIWLAWIGLTLFGQFSAWIFLTEPFLPYLGILYSACWWLSWWDWYFRWGVWDIGIDSARTDWIKVSCSLPVDELWFILFKAAWIFKWLWGLGNCL